MGRTMLGITLGALLLSNPAAAVPGVDEPARIEVNALRRPLVRTYEAIAAGLDAFEKHHALAPAVAVLQFRIRSTGTNGAEPPRVRLEGERGFILPLALDAGNLFTVPRSSAAEESDAELVLNRKRSEARIDPHVRTPGLPDNRRRLGDLRLECQVLVAIAKKEMPLLLNVTVNGLFRTRDWCGFFNERDYGFDVRTDRPILSAVLHEGNRSAALKTGKQSFSLSLYEPSWSDDAMVELVFAEATGTAGETPRTAP